MILSRGSLEIEFFPHPELEPHTSWFSACVRVADVDRLYRDRSSAGLPDHGIPRIKGISVELTRIRNYGEHQTR